MRSRARSMRRPAWLPVATRPAIDAHVLDLRIFGRGQRMEAQTSFRIARVDTVENERMEVDVQVQRIAEALHEVTAPRCRGRSCARRPARLA
jgi:hypothetical protein